MTRILILGATGRTGAAILQALPADAEVTAALRDRADTGRLAKTAASLDTAVVGLTSTTSLRQAMDGVAVVVNAIRLREDIAPTELIDLHERLLAAVETRGRACRVVTVGGAGALRLPGGERFWQSPAFPRATLPRGHAHAALRDHLEAGNAGDTWAYLIPPPAYVPDGPATGRREIVPPALDETAFTDRAISYADFGAAVVEAVVNAGRGTQLIAWQHYIEQ